VISGVTGNTLSTFCNPKDEFSSSLYKYKILKLARSSLQLNL